MADILTPEQRSARMALVRHKDTRPELAVRQLLHKLGYRYRLHGKLPGKPDIVFAGRRKVIFVHGCFWHRHDDPSCGRARVPRSNQEYWDSKFSRNVQRDREHLSRLAAAGWQTLVVWECQVREPAMAEKLLEFLGPRRASRS